MPAVPAAEPATRIRAARRCPWNVGLAHLEWLSGLPWDIRDTWYILEFLYLPNAFPKLSLGLPLFVYSCPTRNVNISKKLPAAYREDEQMLGNLPPAEIPPRT